MKELILRDKVFAFLCNTAEEVGLEDLRLLADCPREIDDEAMNEILCGDERFLATGEDFFKLRPLETFHPDGEVNETEFIITDIETTGPILGKDCLIEIAAIKMKNGEIEDEFESFVATDRRIPPYVKKITGISEKDLQGAPDYKDVLEDYRAFLGDSVFGAHNASFDFYFLRGILSANDPSFMAGKVPFCTLKLAQRLLPEINACGISSLSKIFGFDIKNRHRAMADVYATKQIFDILLERLDRDRAQASLHDLFSLQADNLKSEDVSRLVQKKKKKLKRKNFKPRS